MTAEIDRLDDLIAAVREQTREMQDLLLRDRVSAAVITFQASGTSSVTLLNPTATRKGVIVVNTDANDLYLRYGETATTSSGGWTYKISSGVTWEMPKPIYTGRIDGIWSGDGSGVAEITEM